MSSRATTRGRGRGRGASRGASSASQGTKRKERADLDYEDTPVSTAKKPKAAIEPRQPSNRATRVPKRADSIEPIANLGPAGPDLPRHKRPAGSKAADAAEAAAQAAARAEERDAILARLAALNAAEDEQREAEQQAFIDSLEDLPVLPAEDETGPILTITEDDFERLEDDEAYYSVSEYEKPKAKAPKKAKKPGKRETRAAVEETTKALVAAQAMEKKKNGQNSNAAASSAKAGLSQTWKASVSSKVAIASTPESPKLGGLEDEDARAERPKNATGVKGPRVNEMVHIISSDTEETPFQPKVQAPRKSRVSVKAEPTEKMPALFVDSGKTPRIKMESSLTTAYTPTPEVAADAKDLPLFVAKTWATSFLPALYRELYRSADPMAFGAVGTDVKHPGKATVAILQAVLDAMYPGNTWKIQWGDAICAKAISRVGERRSAFGKAGDAAVQAHFNAPRYFKDHDAALRKRAITQSDALYALQRNGPAFWKYPTPESASHILDPKDPEYIKPKDYLESPMIIATLSQFITAFDDYELIVATHPETGKRMVDPSSELPIGALGMAAAAVERAYGAHKTGQYLKPSAFSAAHVGTAVAGFIVSINNFSVTRWEAILAACGTRAAERGAANEHRLQATSLDGVRENMYEQSSP